MAGTRERRRGIGRGFDWGILAQRDEGLGVLRNKAICD